MNEKEMRYLLLVEIDVEVLLALQFPAQLRGEDLVHGTLFAVGDLLFYFVSHLGESWLSLGAF